MARLYTIVQEDEPSRMGFKEYHSEAERKAYQCGWDDAMASMESSMGMRSGYREHPMGFREMPIGYREYPIAMRGMY